MNKSQFNRQEATMLYRKWYIDKKKSRDNNFDKEQIDDLRLFLFSELMPGIRNIMDEGMKIYSTEIPMLYIGEKIETFPLEILVMKNTIDAINMPGCIGTAEDFESAFLNFLTSVIECSDARYRNGLGFMNRVPDLKFWASQSGEVSRDQLISSLKKSGSYIEYDGIYNTIILKKELGISYSVPKMKIVPSSIVTSFQLLMMKEAFISKKQ